MNPLTPEEEEALRSIPAWTVELKINFPVYASSRDGAVQLAVAELIKRLQRGELEPKVYEAARG